MVFALFGVAVVVPIDPSFAAEEGSTADDAVSLFAFSSTSTLGTAVSCDMASCRGLLVNVPGGLVLVENGNPMALSDGFLSAIQMRLRSLSWWRSAGRARAGAAIVI